MRTSTQIGTVYGVLLNVTASVARRRASFGEPPYRMPPVAPILYVKPRNTMAGDGAAVAVPAEPGCVRIDATIGAVIGRKATGVCVDDALSFVAGYAIVSDVTLPHESVYRPAVRQRCRDGFCPIGAITASRGIDVAAAVVAVSINGNEVHRTDLSNLVRPLPVLLADMTAFMTLEPGDIVLLGAPDDGPVARPGDVVRIEVAGLETLTHTVIAEGHA